MSNDQINRALDVHAAQRAPLGASRQRRRRGARFLAAVGALVLVGGVWLGARGEAAPPDGEKLSSLRVLNRVVLLVKEQYVEPSRIRARDMLLSALDSVEKAVPEVLVTELPGDQIQIAVGAESRSFPIDDVTSLWELSFKLRDVFRFVEARLPPGVDHRDVEYAAINGMLAELDPHSVLLEPRFSQEMKLNTKGEFGGLGIVIAIRDGALTVISPIDGTPAEKVGIKAQDKIVKIGEESTVNMGLDEAVERLRGKPGTPIVIWVTRKGQDEPRRYEIVRAVIKVDSVSSELTGDTAYIKIKSFQGRTAEDVVAALASVQDKHQAKAKGKGQPLAGLILDLRNNPGGLLDQAVEVSNLFLKAGTLVVTQEGQGQDARREVQARAKNHRIDMPVVVLVNGGSASASEIVAGAIKNRERGVVLGDQTFGKGSVQQLYDFPDASSLKLTIGQYLTPGDESIQSVGITPDIQLQPVAADDKTALNIFPDEHTREQDLERHLDDARTKPKKPVYELGYLAEKVDEDEDERRQAASRFGEDFEIRLARRLLEGHRQPNAGRPELLGAFKATLDQVAAEEEKRIHDALAKLGIDWSRAPKVASAAAAGANQVGRLPRGQVQVRVQEAAAIPAGDVLKVSLTAKNTGTTPVHRLRGISRATMGYLSDREFIFGRLQPGEEKTVGIEVKMPKELQSRRDLMRVALADDGGDHGHLDVPVTIEGLPRPRFSYALFIDDTVGGNGDGLLQVGESVELVVGVKNTGVGDAAEPTALLKNLGGSEVFIETGRQRMDALKPGGTGVARFSFKVQERETRPDEGRRPSFMPGLPFGGGNKAPEKVEKVELRLQVFDGALGDYLVEKLVFPIKPAGAAALSKKGVVEAPGRTSVLAAADATAPVVATLEPGTRLDAVAEVNGFVRVRLPSPGVNGAGNLHGYVPAAGVTPAKGKAPPPGDGEPRGLSLVYGRDPPRIRFTGASELVVVDSDRYTVRAQIEDDNPILDFYLFNGDKKVHYRRLDHKGDAARLVNLEQQVQLKPGVNVITVVAREDDEFAQREVLTVFSTRGDPLEKKPTRRRR